jgi:hypothetical protein
MQSITPQELHDLFVPAIHDIVPTHRPYRDERWRYVPILREVPGALRNFHIRFGVAEEVLDGIYGADAIQMEMTCDVFTSYVGLGSTEDNSIISMDGHDILVTLSEIAESSGCGFLRIIRENPSWEPLEEDDEGRRWGAHTFTVHYLQADPNFGQD